MSRVGIVADDVTGGTTVGALLAQASLIPTLLFDDKDLNDSQRSLDTVIVSTNSRTLDPGTSYKCVKRTTEKLAALGVKYFFKRIDSTCRGNVGAEIEGMMDVLDKDGIAIIVPAMPQSKKIMVGGYLIVDSVLVSETEVARDVRTPVRESNIVSLIQNQVHEPVVVIPLSEVEAGCGALVRHIRRLHATGVRMFVVDATNEQQIDTIAQSVVALGVPVVSVDPGPFTVSLLTHLGVVPCIHQPSRILTNGRDADESGTIFAVVGSATHNTHKQVDKLLHEPRTVSVEVKPLRLISSDSNVRESEINSVLEDVSTALNQSIPPRVLLLGVDTAISGVEPSTPEQLAKSSGTSAAGASNQITEQFGLLAAKVAAILGAKRCAGLYVTGGDTMVHFCNAIGAQGAQLIDYLIPQVDISILIGGTFTGIPMICKGGLTGTPLTAVQAINRLFAEHQITRNKISRKEVQYA